MTQPNPNPDRPAPTAGKPAMQSSSQRCLLYLLGELDREDAVAFENQLEFSSELGDELLRNADLIATLSSIEYSTNIIYPTTDTPPSLPVAVERSSWWLAASILAVAASLAILLSAVAFYRSEKAADSEDMLIARAWADSRNDDSFIDLEVSESENDEALTTLFFDDASDVDSALSWMVFAVSTDLSSDQPETTNDG